MYVCMYVCMYVNARFLLNEHGDSHFLFYKFNENNILNN